MTTLRSAALLALLSASAAVLLALASRAPADVRLARPGPGAADPSLGARFTDGEIERHAAYRGPSYLSAALSLCLQIVFLVVLAAGPWARLVGSVERLSGGWAAHAALVAVAVIVASAVVTLPLSFVRSYVIDTAWGLSTQSLPEWLRDRGLSLIVGATTGAVASVVFFGVQRWQPRTWWLWGWATFSLLTVVLVFVYPVIVAPLFNKFTPVKDESLAARVGRLAEDAGIAIDEVLVADASRRTTAENAYVAGFGSSKRLVLYDTLVASGTEAETAFVVAHELGHRAHGHIWKNVAITSAGLLAGFGALAVLGGWSGAWAWAGASGAADLRAVPVLLLFTVVASLVSLPVESSISRRFEAQADAVAVDLTRDPDTAVRVFRRLAFSNLADLKPPGPIVWALYTHPPTAQRIRAAKSGAAGLQDPARAVPGGAAEGLSHPSGAP